MLSHTQVESNASALAKDVASHWLCDIPGWKIGDLVALVSAEVLSTESKSWSSTSTTGSTSTTYQQLTLNHNTVEDQTDCVSSDGRISLHLASWNHTYRLFAFYQVRTHAKNIEYASKASTNIFDNGSYSVDHFSSRVQRRLSTSGNGIC